MTDHVFSISGGVTSWAAARITISEDIKPGDEVTLVFADTLVEDSSVYEFLEEGAKNLGYPILRLCDGRTPWELFEDEKMIGNSRVALCSRILKRDLINRWRKMHFHQDDSIHYVGLDWMEINRYERHKKALDPWRTCAPLIDRGLSKTECIRMAADCGLRLPDAYDEGFSHANCSGMCVRAGQGHWSRLYRLHPERFLFAMEKEEQMRQMTGKDISMLSYQRRNNRYPLTLRKLKEELDAQPSLFPEDDGGGCGCALQTIEEDSP